MQGNPLKTFEVHGIDGVIKYRQYTLPHGQNPQDLPIEYLLRDALHYSRDVTYIDLIRIDSEHGQGYGSYLLQAFVNEHEDEFIILSAGLVGEDDLEIDLDSLIDSLTIFYEKNGFININHLIGFCSESVVFGYNNTTLRERLNLGDR